MAIDRERVEEILKKKAERLADTTIYSAIGIFVNAATDLAVRYLNGEIDKTELDAQYNLFEGALHHDLPTSLKNYTKELRKAVDTTIEELEKEKS